MEKLYAKIDLIPGEIIRKYYKIRGTREYMEEYFSGYFVLTSHRILIYKKKKNTMFSSSLELHHIFYLSNIKHITYCGLLDKYVSIDGIKVFVKGVKITSLAATIWQAAKAERPIHGPASQQQIQQIVNVNDASAPPLTPAQVPLSKDFIYCTQCGYQNDTEVLFCKNCGTSVD